MISDGTNSATYTYLANSPLVSQIAFKQNATTRMTTTKVYDYLNRLKSISSVSSATTNSFAYSYNYANQRSGVTNSDNSKWVYQYDDLGQVISGKKYWSDGTPVAGQQFEYAFDDIGNRTSTKAGGDQSGANLRSATYDANALNQYDSRTVPGAVDIIGSATNTATVTVNNQATYRKGNYFRDQLSLNNASAAVWAGITNVAVLNNGTNVDIVATNLGYLFLPKTPETFTYDDDGNLKQDGRWQYVWDGENRLVSMTSLTNAPTASKLKLDFAYDYMGRRVQKMVWTNNGTSYFPLYTNRFVYDGWNLLAELNPASGVIRSYMWGTDLSGTLQGAGGVGGLLAISDAILGSSFVAFDANGNLIELFKTSDGSAIAYNEFSPFGEALRATRQIANGSGFGFSTKYQDCETDLLYYGYRYYNAKSGTWLSRDPKNGKETFNLYGFLNNFPVNACDPLGLEIYPGGVPSPTSIYPPNSPEPAFWDLAEKLAAYWYHNDGATWTEGGDVLKLDPNIKNAVVAVLESLFQQECKKSKTAHASERGTSLQFLSVGVDSLPLRATLNFPNPYLKLKIDYDATLSDDCCCYNTFRVEAHWYDIADMDHWYDFFFWSSEHFLGYGKSYPIDISWTATSKIEKCSKGPYKRSGWPFD